jgi:hypothetical protein
VDEPAGKPASETTIPQDIAWLVFTKAMNRDSALPDIRASGDRALAFRVMNMVTIVG